MATTDVVKDEYSSLVELEHSHDHEHAPFIAHHFHTAEQQFDSGKLGIWLFLVTEVLFFGGLFVAYIIYRYNRPEVFIDAHHHLDTLLGGLNTIVLLFSSLTMAWGVRAAQMGDNRTTAVSILVTMVCAALFLGVKAVEYSHKWDIGLLPGNMFSYDPNANHDHGLISNYLILISSPFALLLVGFAIAAVMNLNTGKKVVGQFYGGMAITALGYFLGVGVGVIWMAAMASGHSEGDHAGDHAGEHHAAVSHESLGLVPESSVRAVVLDDKAAAPVAADGGATTDNAAAATEEAPAGPIDKTLGIFFSIYYCMTGLHAIHIIAGIIALAWVFYRSLAAHWRPDYFGPVDFVGLYWHLVDLIWIYLFPLMYLIR
jgi:cytochrome c oxidase subunit 3